MLLDSSTVEQNENQTFSLFKSSHSMSSAEHLKGLEDAGFKGNLKALWVYDSV